MRTPLISIVLATAAAAPLFAQAGAPLPLPRLQGPVVLDGIPGEAAWQAIPSLPITMYAPVFRGAPSESTEIRIAYDERYLYASGRFFDSRPGEIRINSLYRDRWSGDDAFAIYIDTFNDNENAVWFLTNPAGVRMDRSLADDGNSVNESWNASWDVAARVTAEGWSAEMRIPLSSLRFQVRADGTVEMGISATRWIARTNERVTWPAIDPRFNFRQSSPMQDVVLAGVVAERPVHVTPYVLSGGDRRASLPAGGSAWGATSGVVGEAGADLRWAPSENLNLDLSVNTDFAQVEADDEQLNLSRFPLFFPEKRQFFQERSGVFSFDFKSGGRLFHSRQIGLAPDRTPLRILGGGRLVARTGGWDVGLLSMQASGRDSLAPENLSVARLRRRMFNEFSFAGAMVTARAGADGHNFATGLDAGVRLFGNDYVTARGAATFDDAQPDGIGLASRSQVFLEWDRRAASGLRYFAQYQRAGAEYRPDLGFLPRQDFTRVALYSQYRHLRGGTTGLRAHGPGAIAYAFYRNGDNALETAYMAYWWIYEFRSGSSGWLEVIHNYEDVPAAFGLGGAATVNPGIYRFATFWFNYTAGTGNRTRMNVDTRMGGFYDGRQVQLTLEPVWNASRHLEVGGLYQFNQLRFPGRAGLDGHVARLRVGAALDAKASAIAFVQYNSVRGRAGLNLRLRYNLREGSDIWLVWDEGVITERDATVPRAPFSEARALRVKFSHMLAM